VERQQRTICQQMDTLRTKQREFAAITENMSEGFLVVGKQGEVASYNTSALKILDVEIPVPEERTPGSLNILNFNRSHEFRTAVDEALAGHHHEENLKIGTRMYQIIANPVTEKQNVTGAVIVILDITEREEREDLRREFSANVSHELKTPLTSISGYAEIMKNGLVKPEDMKRFSENIYQEAQRMITLIGDIIKLSQLDENRVELEKQAVDLYPIAQFVVSRLKERASQAKVTLEIRGEGQIIEGTSQILDEMIYNLCDNGIKYNKAGGHVNVTVGSRQGCPFVSVEDNGIGIPEEDQKRVFERFYRVDKSHSRQIGGTGLGLSIVKHGAIYHNAKVEVESTPGRGTSITIVFPEGAAK
jgi:two-component system phosphate regulon sensor histidine kinase PhoR